MGVEAKDCHQVARLLGTKLFLTDLVGYSELGVLIKNREHGLLPAISVSYVLQTSMCNIFNNMFCSHKNDSPRLSI